MAVELDDLGPGFACHVDILQPNQALWRSVLRCTRVKEWRRRRALGLITRAPGGILKGVNVGRIEEGSCADFAIYDGNPTLRATSYIMSVCSGKYRH